MAASPASSFFSSIAGQGRSLTDKSVPGRDAEAARLRRGIEPMMRGERYDFWCDALGPLKGQANRTLTMTIDEQLNIFETDLENFVPKTPTEQKLLKEASTSLSAFRAYAEREGLLPKEITSDEEREMWLRHSVLDPLLKLYEAVVDDGKLRRNDVRIGMGLKRIRDGLLWR